MKVSDLHHKYSLGPTNSNSFKREIMAITKLHDFCIKCGNKTVPHTNAVPFEKTYIKIPGRCCMHCGQFYTTKCNELYTAVNHNQYAEGFKIITPDEIPESQIKAIRYFYKNKNAIVLLQLKNINTGETLFLTITKENAVSSETVYSYKEKAARKILAVLSGKIDSEPIKLGEFSYELIRTFPQNHKACIQNLLLDTIFIRESGGLYNPESKDVIVDILVFSPVTKIFEILKATYDTEDENYYIGVTAFKRFIKEYGKPDIKFAFQRTYYSDNELLLNDESILRIFGYSVNAKKAMTDSQRHLVLTEIIECKIATADEIIRILRTNISLRPQAKYTVAREKWESDIKFVQEYKTKPSDVLIYNQDI